MFVTMSQPGHPLQRIAFSGGTYVNFEVGARRLLTLQASPGRTLPRSNYLILHHHHNCLGNPASGNRRPEELTYLASHPITSRRR
jgi:hypothetical protein